MFLTGFKMNMTFMLLIVVLFLNICIKNTYSQNFTELYNLYQDNKFDQLKIEFGKIEKLNSKNLFEYRFFEALLSNNAEVAKTIYDEIYNKSSGKVKLLAAEKLMQYFYARGYYLTASEYQKYVLEHENQLPVKNNDIIDVPSSSGYNNRNLKYYIQVGAFGLRDNAMQLKNMLETQNVNCSIVPKNINNSRLYCVWIEGKKSLESTMEYANVIKERYDVNYRIIKE